MSGERSIRSIAVAGGGIVALSAALAFARALPKAAIRVVGTASDPAALADAMPVALAAGRSFHRLIGIDQADLLAAGVATPFLGTQFRGWSAGGEDWWHGLGHYGKPAGAIPFDQLWVAARDAGRALPYDLYSVAVALARAGKFVPPASDPEFIGSRFDFGLRLDPDRYGARLRKVAENARIDLRKGEIAAVERQDDDRVAALRLAGGERVAADLFIDCTGPSAVIASAVDSRFEDWSHWFPFATMRIADADGAGPVLADLVQADDEGWRGEWPLGARNVAVELSGAGDGIALTRGRRLRPWVGNVLALGDAATALDPLHRLNLDLAHHAILLALELLPGRDFHPVETDEYNRRAEQAVRRVRDFLALHYLRSGRETGPWAETAAAEPPDSLARTLDHFTHRGRLPFQEDETISRDSWSAALLGLGVIPRSIDPPVLALPLDEAFAAMDSLAREIDAAVAGVPPYAALGSGSA